MGKRVHLFIFSLTLLAAALLFPLLASAELEAVVIGDKMHIVTSTGEMIYPPSKNWYQMDEIQSSIYRMIAWEEGKGERCALYNAHTGMDTGFVYWQAYGADKEYDPILVLDETGYYFIDVLGVPISSWRYHHAQPFSCGLAWTVAAVDQEGMPVREQAGFINTAGECVIPGDTIYPYDEFFADERCLVLDRESGKYGYMNTAGEMCIPAIYDYAETFCSGYAYVELEGIAQYINTEGAGCNPEN